MRKQSENLLTVNFFANNPFVKILSFWLSGILAAFYFPSFLAVFVVFWIMSGILVLNGLKTKTYPFDWHVSVFLALSFMVAAFVSVPRQQAAPRADNASHRFLATVLENPGEKPNSLQSLIEIEACDSAYFDNRIVVVYFEKAESVRELLPGDQILVNSKLQLIQPTDEPFAFDYRKLMASRGIFYSCYLRAGSYVQLDQKKEGSIIIHAERFRYKLVRQLKKFIKNEEQVQVISALTLGYRKELTAETRSYFASTGAMHVLAVSGLHVGMIYLFLMTALAFLKRNRLGNFLFFVIIASVLWFYALLTGFSPSVQRATVMFTTILIGNSIRRTSSIYNSIAASAFVLLLINPDMLHEVGFQLSYAAVISIVFFFPRLEKIYLPKNKPGKWMWQLFYVSLSAQLGVSALSMYYFHQFPSYFWLSNFFVVPAAYFILGFTFLFFIATPIAPLAAIVAKGLSGVTFCIIFILRKIDRLPFALTENVSISTWQLFFLTGMLISLIFFIKQKRKAYFFVVNGFILLFLFSGLIEKVQHFNQKKLIYYARGQQVHLINGRKNYLIYHEDDPDIEKKTQAAIRELKLSAPIMICLKSCENYQSEDLMIDKQTVVFLNHSFQLGNAGAQNKMKPTIKQDFNKELVGFGGSRATNSTIGQFIRIKIVYG